MSARAEDVNAVRAQLAEIATGRDIEAVLFATLDFLAVQIAALALADTELGDGELQWAVTTLPSMVAAHRAAFEAQGRLPRN